MLASTGATSGVGDIHGALYSAYAAKDGVFRDVTAGTNGSQSDVDRHVDSKTAAQLPVNARTGYDTVTGLGAPLWTLLTPYVFSPKAPQARAAIDLATPHQRGHTNRVRVSWHPTVKAKSLAAASAKVVVRQEGNAKLIYQRGKAPATGSYHFKGVPGGNYVVTVRETDLSGKQSPPDSALLVVPYDDSDFFQHGGWHREKSKVDLGGSHLQTAQSGATISIHAKGRRYFLLVHTGPTYGKLAALVGGKRVHTFDLYSASPGTKVLDVFGSKSATRKARTLTFRCTGKRGIFATGSAVDVDGLSVLH
jgi:hypothetical protein